MKNLLLSIIVLVSLSPLSLIGQSISFSPDTGQQNDSFGVTVTGVGTNFIASSTTCVQILASPTISLTSVNASSTTILTGNIGISSNTTVGTYDAIVYQGAGCSGTPYTCSDCFTITDLPGSISSSSPSNGEQGVHQTGVVINGFSTDFTSNTTCVQILASPATIDATNINVTNATTLEADFSIPPNTTPGSYDIRVYEGAGCSGDSYICNNCYTVNNASMTMNPNEGSQNSTFGVTISGSGFNFTQASWVSAQVMASPTIINLTGINIVSSSTITGTIAIPSSTLIDVYNVNVDDGDNFVPQSCTDCFAVTTFVPVELIRFDGKVKDRDILLSWATATESNSAYFSIERSTNGQAWRSIGQLKAAGESQQVIEYQFTDTNPVNGVNYYRLHQVDIDGTEDYSETISVNYKYRKQAIQVFPNPTSTSVNLSIFSQNNRLVDFNIIDVTGQSVLRQNAIQLVKGTDQITLATETLDAGIYFIQVIDENGAFEAKQFIKL